MKKARCKRLLAQKPVNKIATMALHSDVNFDLIKKTLSASSVFWKAKPQFRELSSKNLAAICGAIVVRKKLHNQELSRPSLNNDMHAAVARYLLFFLCQNIFRGALFLFYFYFSELNETPVQPQSSPASREHATSRKTPDAFILMHFFLILLYVVLLTCCSRHFTSCETKSSMPILWLG